MNKIRILLVDDHAVVREGARLIISRDPDCDVCCVATSGPEALDLAISCRPDVVVLDLHIPGMNGVAVAREIKNRSPSVEIVAFSGHEMGDSVGELLELGVRSLVRKTDVAESLVSAIKAAAEHKPFFTPEIGQALLAKMFDKPSGVQLTKRERDVTRLVVDGKTSKEIAAALRLSWRTVEVHRAAVMRKLGLSSTAEIVRYAIRNGIIEA